MRARLSATETQLVLGSDAVALFPTYDVRVDLTEFEQLAQSALDDRGIATAKGALAVYGGELLPQDPYEPWAEHHRLHLARLYTELVHQARDWHQALSVDPTDELAHLALAQRYAELGDRVAALRQLDRLDQVMRHELGLAPSEQAVALRRRLLVEATPETPSGGELTARRSPGRATHVRHARAVLHIDARLRSRGLRADQAEIWVTGRGVGLSCRQAIATAAVTMTRAPTHCRGSSRSPTM